MSGNKTIDKLKIALDLHQAGNFQQAESIYRQILKVEPRNPDALHLLGAIFLNNKDYISAVSHIKKAISIYPSVNYFITLAKVYTCQNNSIEAINCYKTVLSSKPDYVEVYNVLANLLYVSNRIEEAIECYLNAIRIKPEYVEAYYNLGNILLNNNDIDSAKEYYNQAIKLKPDYADAYYNLGAAFQLENNTHEAIKYYEKALLLKSDYLEVYYNLATAYLIEKNFEKGWDVYRQIRHLKQEKYKIDKSLIETQWVGESLEGKTIYVYHEQGIGDTIFSARYLPVLNSMGAKVIFEPQAGLEELFRQSDLNAEIIDNLFPEDNMNFDTHISAYYLLSILNINTDNIPCQTGYLKADLKKAEYYKQKYFNNDKFKVGIVWQGSPGFKNDKKRSVSLEKLLPLVSNQNIKLYSLQKGMGTEQLFELQSDEIIDLGSSFNDFSDTAAAIDNLDLVISVDTAVAHLAGALGKSVWMMIPYSPDWRWFLNTDECLWYKSLRLFRQNEPGNWDEVIERIQNSLCTIANNV
ncbi:MAG: tetratricopeptide repeat protein [Candidatus Gastranaerophilales bacterium]|nr:tetratricopeptide repeat protein [Candidatus Gastranaerophilales bacterium]